MKKNHFNIIEIQIKNRNLYLVTDIDYEDIHDCKETNKRDYVLFFRPQ